MCVGVCVSGIKLPLLLQVCARAEQLQPKIWRTMSLCLSTHLRGQVRGPDGRITQGQSSLKLGGGGGGGAKYRPSGGRISPEA